MLLSKLYGFGLVLKSRIDEKRFPRVYPVPVVSVGNLSVGGEGKTPLAMKIASLFLESDFRPAILTLGYKRKKSGIFTVDPGSDSPRTCGDEAYLMAKNLRCPVIVGKDRGLTIEEAIGRHRVNVVILDDGFQVKDVKKDVEIVIVKQRRNLNLDLFPLGPLREPFSSLDRADILVLNRGFGDGYAFDIPKAVLRKLPIYTSRYKVLNLCNIKTGAYKDYRSLSGKEVVAFSGLADNDSFFELLEKLNAKIKKRISFPDHHHYSKRDLQRILENKAEIYVTTEKDAVKIRDLEVTEDFYYLTIEMVIENESEFFGNILRIINEKRGEDPRWRRESLYSTQL